MIIRPYVIELLGTPEAGKTTVSKRLQDSLTQKGYTVSYIRESAEIVPKEFLKGSIEAHIWMRLNTAKEVLHSLSCGADIVLVDRGIFDTLFWDTLFFKRGQLTSEELDICQGFFKALKLYPDFVILLSTSPDEAIKRRGGEGRIVTKQFVEHYNNMLLDFFDEIHSPKYSLDTTFLSRDDVQKICEKIIEDNYNRAIWIQ